MKNKYITVEDYDRLLKDDSYWRNRWAYMSRVIEMLRLSNPSTILEIGPYKSTLSSGSDTMDIVESVNNLTYKHDATATPWPIKDNAYDMVVALQVWEHLGDKQAEAFSEVMRISKEAILSFPYMWNRPGNIHHGIDYDTISKWTLNVKPHSVEHVGNRVIYHFKFNK
jgi:hypothetical protein